MSFYKLRWLILIIFPVGLIIILNKYSSSQETMENLFLLTIVSFLASIFILSRLKGNLIDNFHLWTIYLVFLSGHYVEFYLSLHWETAGIDIKTMNSNFSYYVYSGNSIASISEIVTTAYKVSTISICALALAIYLSTRKNHISRNHYQSIYFKNSLVFQKHTRNYFISYFFIIVTISILLLFLHVDLKVGALQGNSFQGANLPFKLEGLIHFSNTLFIPFILLIFIYISEIFSKRLSRFITIYFLFHALAVAFITTSKMPVPFALLGLFIVWKFSLAE
jgi:hypothetical protein